MFPRKHMHGYTWVSPDGSYKNQIDYVLVNIRFKNSILNVLININKRFLKNGDGSLIITNEELTKK